MRSAKPILVAYFILLCGADRLPAQTALAFQTLVSFDQTNGADPQAGLTWGRDGDLYGTATFGGAGGSGTIFRMDASGGFTNLVSFSGTNGADPRAGLLLGMDGNFYGTTFIGGTNNSGLIFELTGNGTLATVYNFSFESGAYPTAGLFQDQQGNFYGTTTIGGTNEPGGTVFRLGTNGEFNILASFELSEPSGDSPYAGLVEGTNGSFYGTTCYGGTNDYGTVYKVDGNGDLATLVSFDYTNGANPYGGLVTGWDGQLYGTTSRGGAVGYGTVFKIDAAGNLQTLVSFNNTNGAAPLAALLRGPNGNLYGTTSAGGNLATVPNGHGTVFELTTNNTLATLFFFNGTNGDSPQGLLVQDALGNLYGTTANGGTNGFGTIFRLSQAPPPHFIAAKMSGNMIAMSWTATTGNVYQVYYSTNLHKNAWVGLGNPLTATNDVVTNYDNVQYNSQRFYQIRSVP